MNDDLTILVKKKDGSFERKKLSELGVLPIDKIDDLEENKIDNENLPVKKEAVVPPINKVVVKPVEKKAVRVPNKKASEAKSRIDESSESNTGVVEEKVESKKIEKNKTENVLNETKKNDIKNAKDFGSLLEEKLDSLEIKNASKLSDDRQNQVDKIIARLSFNVSNDYINRLRSIIQLYLKEVRTKDQTKETVLRSIKDGGLGITSIQAGELINLTDKQRDFTLPAVESENEPVLYKANTPAVSTPFNSFLSDPKKQKLEKEKKINDILKPNKKNTNEPFKLNNSSVLRAKKTVVDIAPPTKNDRVYGPIEEIANFSLLDLHRLSPDFGESVGRFKQKFVNLKEESIILFFKAKNAWKKSPLYKNYMSSVLNALSKQANLKDCLAENNGININEVENIVLMEKELNL